MSSGSPPTRDKLRCDDKARVRRDWRNERLRDIATALTDRSPESSLALPAESLLHLKKGWLWLKTIDGEFVMRWVVLCGPSLNIYQEQDEQATPEIVVELSSVTSYNEVPTETKFGFEIKWAGPTLVLCAVTSGIRSNWLQALKKAAPIASSDSPITTPPTPRSLLFSSDEEYRTASEGGRRGSEDWSELPPSPPLTRTSLTRVKDRTRVRPRLPRCQSRQSTLDSTSTDEMDCVKLSETVELNNEINKQNVEINDLQKQLAKSVEEVRNLEEEIARLKKFQAEAVIQEKKAKEMMLTFERTERELNQRNSQAELKFTKEQRSLQRRLLEAENLAKTYEDRCDSFTRELQTKQRILTNLQDEVASIGERFARSREENDLLFKRVQELEGRTCSNKHSIRVDSLADLMNIDLDVDIEELGQDELKEYCLDLRGRFEKAVLEIRAVKRELRDSHEKCDNLELTNYSIQNNMEITKQESQAEINLLVSRLEHLTTKLNAAEKQIRSKLKNESRDKRRFSINKEVEDKVTELEAKILALERGRTKRKYKRERSSERSSPIDDRSLRRLRRKSLDSATSSEPMKLLMRLSTLENQVTNVNASNESLNVATETTKIVQDAPAKTKIDECLGHVAALRSSLKRSSSSPTIERLASLEQNLNELSEIVDSDIDAEMNVVNSSASAAVKQLQSLLVEKLTSLSERKRALKENNKLDAAAKLQILAEKVAYENILIGRIQEALSAPATGDVVCDRLIRKEVKETAHLINSLQKKLSGGGQKQPHVCRTSADYLSKILAECLMTAAGGFVACKNFVETQGPSLDYLEMEQKKLGVLLEAYKSTKLPQLAEVLAAETLAIDKNCRLKKLSEDVVKDLTRTAREMVNSELVQSEINHVLLRAAQIYQGNIDADHAYFFTFFASERAALELWSDSVGDCLYEEINKNINELTELYQNQLNKLQRQNWRRRVESERNSRTPNTLLQEFADVIAHKALIDARICVLSGKCNNSSTKFATADCLNNWLQNDNYWDCLENQSVQMNQSLEAEFTCMIDRCSKDCYALVGQPELEEVLGYLNDLADEIGELQKHSNLPVDYDDVVVKNWSDVCSKCRSLRDKLEDVRRTIGRTSPKSVGRSPSFKRFESLEDHRPVYLGTEYLTQVENLRAAYRCALASCKERHQEADIEQLQMLCERVLVAMEQWHRRTIQEMREAHAQEMETLRQEKEQALAEETQATLAALDAMRKAHEAEVQREVAKFKQDYARQQRDDILDLSERLSVKCLEAAALEEQLGSATRQLTHAQQHILQLERNPQLSPMQK
ncbi:outspread, partial [Asbolus verrucosus]